MWVGGKVIRLKEEVWKGGKLEMVKKEVLKLEKWKGEEADRWKGGKLWQVGKIPTVRSPPLLCCLR